MNPLQLSPFPSLRHDESSGRTVMHQEGYVDDSVILALLSGPVSPRHLGDPGDLALAADDMDFAGWRLSRALPRRATEPVVRRPSPPVAEESGIGEPHRGHHRWWLAGLAGVLSTLVFSVLLYSLASREVPAADGFTTIQAPSGKSTGTPATRDNREVPQLSDANPLR